MIDGDASAWFLARPRRFGKSLTVSTLEAVFSGDRDLFKGLDIEPRLGEEFFAPRPVIRLDMSKVATNASPAKFMKNLGGMTARKAAGLGVENLIDTAPNLLLNQLITGLAEKTGQQVVVLIDEYDSPLLDFLQKPDEMERVRQMLSAYYAQLKATSKYIYFIFITGISKFSSTGLASGLNSLFDISVSPKFGAICGFTHEELRRDFGPRLEAAAEALKMGRDELLERMRSYYEGFCFDGETRVYNPFSALLFLSDQEFANYWFESGSPELLAKYMRDRRLTVEQFRGMQISHHFARNPGELDRTPPAGFLYQSGYLSLRQGKRPGTYTLDYSNQEVSYSVSRLWVAGFLDGPVNALHKFKALRSAFNSADAKAVIEVFNQFIARLPYDDYHDAVQQMAGSPASETDLRECFYRSSISTLLSAAGLVPSGEVHGRPGRTDLVVESEGKVWVLELKVCREPGDDQETAGAAIARILENGWRPGEGSIAVGMAVDCAERTITAWRVLGGEPAPGPEAAEKQ